MRQDNAHSNFIYDSHGNQTFADHNAGESFDRTIRYNAQDQAYEIFKGTAAAPNRMARFWYDPSGNRYKREDSGVGIAGTRRTLYIGNIEIVSENGTTTYKRYIGGALVQNVVNGIAANRYLFTDHIGSVIAATNEAGVVLEGGGFNAFGERRTNGSATSITTTGLASTTRGFTGHEMLDDGLDVIHMNGRIYDPTLGRFLQPDPVIQAPGNPQNWNAYTYVFNNPYRYTDPTGMIGLEERQWLGTAFAIVATVLAPQGSGFWYSVFVGATAGAISGGSQGALIGAFTAGLFYGIGQGFSQIADANAVAISSGESIKLFMNTGLTGGQFAASVAAHGIAGGVMSALQGGNFGNGFLAAAGAQLASPYIDTIGDGAPSYAGTRVAVAALIGGTVSALTGGKFASGALTAAFSRAFNAEKHWQVAERTAAQQIREAYALKGIPITVLEQVKIAVQMPNGAIVNAVADYAYMADDGVMHFGEVKTGLFARLTKNQKIVYAAINAGKVFLTNSSQAKAFELKAGLYLAKASLTLHAVENSRAWKQVGRLMPAASREALGKVGAVLGGTAATGVMLFFEMQPYDPVNSLMMSCPQCSPSASYKVY